MRHGIKEQRLERWKIRYILNQNQNTLTNKYYVIFMTMGLHGNRQIQLAEYEAVLIFTFSKAQRIRQGVILDFKRGLA